MNPTAARFAPTFVTASSQLIELDLDASLGDPKNSASYYNNIAHSFAGFSVSRRPLGATAAAVQTALGAFITAKTTKFDIIVNGTLGSVDLTTTWPTARRPCQPRLPGCRRT